MTDLRVTLIQISITWENPAANLARYDKLLQHIEGPTDLVILPEMFTTGFTMAAEQHAERMNGLTVKWMENRAVELNAVVTGSLIIEEDGRYFNRLIWMRPDRTYATYDKRHRFAMAGEHERFTAGTERLIVEVQGWRVCPLICYDLRFPVWARNDDAYDLLIYTANWPDKRAYDWNTLLKARAIENQCYVAAVNRVGVDENGHSYSGDSCVIGPGWQHTLWHGAENEATRTVTLSAMHLAEVREQLPFLADRDDFSVNTQTAAKEQRGAAAGAE